MTDFNDNTQNNTPVQPETPAPEQAPQQPYYQPPQYAQQPVQPTEPVQGGEYQPPRYAQQYQQPYEQQPQYTQQPYPQQYQQPVYQQPKVYAPKSRIAASILAILFGTFGVHNFYLGRIGIGVAQLLISVLSCFWLSPVSMIWGLVEGIQLLEGKKTVDGHGLPFVD